MRNANKRAHLRSLPLEEKQRRNTQDRLRRFKNNLRKGGKMNCIIKINNQDNLCVARSIVVMKAHADWKALEEIAKQPSTTADQREAAHQAHLNYKNLSRQREQSQRKQGELARELHQKVNVPEGRCGLQEWKQFQSYLSPDYQLQVLCGQTPFMLLYQGPSAPKQINLVKMGEHMMGCSSKVS